MFRRKGADCHPLLGTRILHTFPVRFNRIFHKNSIVLKEKMANTNSTGNNAIVVFDGLSSNEVQNIMKRVVVRRSEDKYKNENMKLLLWIYKVDNLREEVLQECFVERLHEASSSLVNNSDMRSLFKDALDSVKRGANNCSIVLKILTFNIFPHYLITRTNKNQKYLSMKMYGIIWNYLCHSKIILESMEILDRRSSIRHGC